MKKLLSVVLAVLGLLLLFAGIGLISLTQQFLLYLGGALTLIAVILFIRS